MSLRIVFKKTSTIQKKTYVVVFCLKNDYVYNYKKPH